MWGEEGVVGRKCVGRRGVGEEGVVGRKGEVEDVWGGRGGGEER